MEIEKDNVATIEDPSMKPPPPSQGVIIEQIADGDDVAPRPSTLLSLRMNRNQRLSRNPTKMTGLISLSVINGDESVEGDPIVQQMDEHIQSPRDEENSEQRFVGPDNHSASEDEDVRQVVPTRCLF
eukprot:scaffold1030_cov82-Skeletonema_marinoi.AAC.6